MIRELITSRQIAARVRRLGREITESYQGRPVLVLVVMNGAMFFAADLCKHLLLPLEIDSLSVSSYDNNHSTGQLNFHSRPKLSLQGKNILVVDDVLDTGVTMFQLQKWLQQQGAAEVHSCVLVEKNTPCRPAEVAADWVGFHLDDLYLVGYGMDDRGQNRQLPFIGYLTN